MRWLLLCLLSLSLLHCAHAPEPAASAPPAPTVAAADWPAPQPPALRLPDTVRLVRAALDLTLLPAEPTYAGVATFDVEVRAPVRQVWLHAQDLRVSGARVLSRNRTLEARVSASTEGRLGVLLPQTLEPGPAQLILTFSGQADRERSQGIYAVEEGGEPYLYTFFEPIDARRAFPCFDEPEAKVPWRLTFTVKQSHVARANAPVEKEEPLPGGRKRVTFAESRPMPSYLVAFMVGPFDQVKGGAIGRAHVPLHFILPRGRGPEAAYAVSVTPRIITLLEDFFDQTYPYEKLDVAVVPRFWGTMEHPGIVAMGQPLTLMRPGEETLEKRQSYTNVAIHELGHYWFGDVVTCRWWDDIWLNESLTSWLDAKITDQFDPAWNYALEGQARSAALAFSTDARITSPPVRKPIANNDDIVGSFDNGTTYAKGASLLNMLEGWLGFERVRDMLRAYVRKHAWGVATSEDFLATLEGSLGVDPAHVFKDFIDQAGVPRVTAELTCQEGKAPRVKLAQERFLPAGSEGSTARTWHLPVCVRTGGGGGQAPRTCAVLAAATAELELPGQGCPSWVLLNAGGTGYYRSGYAREQLSALTSTPSGSLTTAERIALLSDVRASVERGDLLLGEAMKLVPATVAEPERLIVQGGAQILSSIAPERLPPAERELYRAWLRELYAPRARALGWLPKPGERDDVKRLRMMMLGLAAAAGKDPALLQEAARLARAWLLDHKSVSQDVSWLALRLAARDGDRALFDTILAQARAAQDTEERGRLLGMLGVFRDPALVKQALGLVAGTELDLRDTVGILVGALFTPESRDQAWAFYQEHVDALFRRMRSDEQSYSIEMLGELCDARKLSEVEALLRPRVANVEGGPRSLDRALESIRLCIESERRQQPSVLEFLRSRGKAGKGRAGGGAAEGARRQPSRTPSRAATPRR